MVQTILYNQTEPSLSESSIGARPDVAGEKKKAAMVLGVGSVSHNPTGYGEILAITLKVIVMKALIVIAHNR